MRPKIIQNKNGRESYRKQKIFFCDKCKRVYAIYKDRYTNKWTEEYLSGYPTLVEKRDCNECKNKI